MAVGDKLSALKIKANLIANETIGLMEINAEVEDGVAVLRGEVNTEQQKLLAEELAYEIGEIEEVVNEISVLPISEDAPTDAHLGYSLMEGDYGETAFAIGGESAGPSPTMATSEQFPGEFMDEDIEHDVSERLASESEIDATDVRSKSVNQIVHLEGSVKTPDDLYKLHDVVLNVRGVMGIHSNVAIKEGEIGTQTE